MSTRSNSCAIMIAVMSKSARKYKTRDRSNRYKRIEKLKLEDRYYTDVARSHERKIKKNELEEEQDNQQEP